MSEELDKLTFVEGAVEAAGFVKVVGDYVILFKGNSITRHACTPKTMANLGWDHESGMAASSADRDYVHLFARGVQRQLPGHQVRVVFGRGGRPGLARLGLEAERIFAPDLVVIQNGEHSAFAPEVDRFEEQHHRLIQETKACFPSAGIISVGIWNPRCREEFAACTASDYDECARRVEGIQRHVAEECGIVFVPVSPYENDPANIGNGKVAGVRWHPSDAGMKCYAEALLQAFIIMNKEK